MALNHTELCARGAQDKTFKSPVVDFGGVPMIGFAALVEEARRPEMDDAPSRVIDTSQYSGRVAAGTVIEVS